MGVGCQWNGRIKRRFGPTCYAVLAEFNGVGKVMDSDDSVPGALGDLGCLPHPFDVLAIYALYQTVGNTGGGDD